MNDKIELSTSKILVVAGLIKWVLFTIVPVIVIIIFLVNSWMLFGFYLIIILFLISRIKYKVIIEGDALIIDGNLTLMSEVKSTGSIFNINYIVLIDKGFPKNIVLYIGRLTLIKTDQGDFSATDFINRKLS